MESPTPLTSRVVFIVVAMDSRLPGGRGARDLGDCGEHLRVAGAATEVAGDPVADLFLGRARILGEQRRRRHEDAGMQNPHCGTPSLTNASWSGCRASKRPSPSMVRTERPRVWKASIRQLATGLPSRWTVHAPQSPVPQPSFGPVNSRSSRSASSNVT